ASAQEQPARFERRGFCRAWLIQFRQAQPAPPFLRALILSQKLHWTLLESHSLGDSSEQV
ncbi:MAG: hypothetical protein OXU88_06710, partial [Gammaproteobacteria bacterium]|nr:hypothetical protein [Gammaproteobacteria bacterium]